MDPVRNPYAPGAGQRPPELAGRDVELKAFDVALERVERGRPERSLVLTGLRGVGKTVLLNALRSQAMERLWGTGKVEARPDTSLRRPLTSALHAAVRELSVRHRAPDRVAEVLAVLKAFGLRTNPRGGKLVDRWTPAIDGMPAVGRADSGDIEIDLLELLSDVARPGHRGVGRGRGVHRRDAGPDPGGRVRALRGLPRAVPDRQADDAGRGRPAAPAERAVGVEVLLRAALPLHPDRPARPRRRPAGPARSGRAGGGHLGRGGARRDGRHSGGYPYFVQAYGKAAWDHAPGSPITADDVAVAAPEAEAELAVGFFGSRYERATPAERDYLRAMAGLTSELRPTPPSRPPTWPRCWAASRRPSPPPGTP